MRWAEVGFKEGIWLTKEKDRSKQQQQKIVSALALKNLWIMIGLGGYMLSV